MKQSFQLLYLEFYWKKKRRNLRTFSKYYSFVLSLEFIPSPKSMQIFSINSYPSNDMASPILLDLCIWFDPVYTNHQFLCNGLIPQCYWCLCQDIPEKIKDEVIFVWAILPFFLREINLPSCNIPKFQLCLVCMWLCDRNRWPTFRQRWHIGYGKGDSGCHLVFLGKSWPPLVHDVGLDFQSETRRKVLWKHFKLNF